ncbi:tyrosine-type recombinase/integrase [Vibrio penaeicida]|uniref:Core-binding (CB) domain-containing protein n=1 Tax=Vibrio penaeicida TaxID=104609 RepID=A0AAV5NQT5_9VIBR|nr:tyrosine-type recombinase/integrase [Vibrio penaeicida]RTZ23265.1 integrase [Vibrio penaeicida]GLQ72694.1 hypothetical protein GCM10007932_20540 [Vibrio penaeicida]
MAAKRRHSNRKDFPDFLYVEKRAGKVRYRFTCVDGTKKMFPVGTTEYQAIQAAIAYNAKHRAMESFSLESQKFIKPTDKFNKPLSEWIAVVKNRVSDEENMSPDTYSVFLNDCDRLIERLGHKLSKQIKLMDLNDWLNHYFGSKSKNVYNRKVSFLKKVFAYLADESAVNTNVAEQKKPRRLNPEDKAKDRLDLTIDDFKAIHQKAPLFLRTAMEIALQSTHAVKELHRIKYSIKKPAPGKCGILWFEVPTHQNGVTVYGTLYIHRQKVKNSKASYVAIPVTQAIKDTVERSRKDKLICPYVVHRRNKLTNGIAKECDHQFQCTSKIISRTFSKVRDELNLYSDLPKSLRPTFHEIRRLAAQKLQEMGENPQQRMAHSRPETTKIYTDSNNIEWHEIPAKEVEI